MTKFTVSRLEAFRHYLSDEERAAATIEKYIRDVKSFLDKLPCGAEVSKETVLDYKRNLSEKYKATSANSMLVALNQFFVFCDRADLKVKLFKVQRIPFREGDTELLVEEYKKLVREAEKKGNQRLCLLIQTLCSTGIRVSEHRFITAESLSTDGIRVINKGKERVVFLPKKLQKTLKDYCQVKGIVSGPVFITKNGNPLNRCNIWAEMKALCKGAGISPKKVFPHNLRHLFALSYYRLEKDIVRLADILGHANMETTRIYTSTTAEEYVHSLSRLNLLI